MFQRLQAERRSQASLGSPLDVLRRSNMDRISLANTDYVSARLGYEYTHWIGKPVVRFDTDSSGFALEHDGVRSSRHPLVQCHLALQHYHQFLDDRDEVHRDRFLAAGRLLMEELQFVRMNGRSAVVAVGRSRLASYQSHPIPWVSAIHQGAVIRVLCRMWQETGQQKYLSAALEAVVPFAIPVENGGVLGRVERAGDWYEEYAFPGQCRHVLNGFVAALFSLHELWRVTANASILALFSSGIATLTSNVLDRFDTGYCSRYDLRPCFGLTPTSIRYHNVHVLQLGILSRLTGENCFERVRARWAGYSRSQTDMLWCRFAATCYRASQWRRYAYKLLQAAYETDSPPLNTHSTHN